MNIKNSIQRLLNEANELLKKAHIENYLLDAQLLMSKVLNKDRIFILTNRDYELSEAEAHTFREFINMRQNKMPVKYILNECEFMGINFFVKEGVLIPRPDTEILVEESIREIYENKYEYICDVCTGSGAIGIAIAQNVQNIRVECYDISKCAEEVCYENIRRQKLQSRVSFFHSDLLIEAINNAKFFDAIISNPPYIRQNVIPSLMEDVKNYEPHIALSGGEDGLDFYREITAQSLMCLKKSGMLAFEIGHDQKESVTRILMNAGFININAFRDLAGNDRVVIGFLE